MIKLDKPVKETRICKICGRKKTFVYVWQERSGGLWTKDNKPSMPFMRCPSCKTLSMVEEKK